MTIRNIAIALSASAMLAGALTAGPALAASDEAPSVRVSLTGKSPAQAHADIVKAAGQVCFAATRGQMYFAYTYTGCIRAAAKTAEAQVAASGQFAAKGAPVSVASR